MLGGWEGWSYDGQHPTLGLIRAQLGFRTQVEAKSGKKICHFTHEPPEKITN